MLLNNPFTTLKDFFYIITGQTDKIVGPIGSLEVTEPIGGEAKSGNSMPWYVMPAIILIVIFLVLYAGKRTVDKIIQ